MSESLVDAAAMEAARARLRERMGPTSSRKGAVRVAHRPAAAAVQKSDIQEKVRSTLKKLGVQSFPAVDEVIFHKSDNTFMAFKQPKVSIAPHSNCTQVMGQFELRQDQTQMFDLLNKIKMVPDKATDNDEVPDLVQDFEAVAQADEQRINEID